MIDSFIPSLLIAKQLIVEQFPEYLDLILSEVELQGHDNRTYRLGDELLIRMPTAKCYALKVFKEQELLLKLALQLSYSIPVPIKIGQPSRTYPYPFSIYKWLPGKSINQCFLKDLEKEYLALDLANFLKELHKINDVPVLVPGEHNFWRGDHISVYDKNAHEQIKSLNKIIDSKKALNLWERACATKWNKFPVWIHGDFAVGNLLVDAENKLLAVIDFGGLAVGDPACDLVIAWTYLSGKARDVFLREMNLDSGTLLRGRAWALWKATYELYCIEDKNNFEAEFQKKIINDLVGCQGIEP